MGGQETTVPVQSAVSISTLRDLALARTAATSGSINNDGIHVFGPVCVAASSTVWPDGRLINHQQSVVVELWRRRSGHHAEQCLWPDALSVIGL